MRAQSQHAVRKKSGVALRFPPHSRTFQNVSNLFPFRIASLRRVVCNARMKKIGLALGGGGAKGFAHIPILEVFDELMHPLKGG